MGKDIHALSDFNNEGVIVKNRYKILFLHDVVRYLIDRDMHIFITAEGCAKVDFYISVVMNQAPGVKILLLRRHVTVMISSVLVLISKRVVCDISTNSTSDSLIL